MCQIKSGRKPAGEGVRHWRKGSLTKEGYLLLLSLPLKNPPFNNRFSSCFSKRSSICVQSCWIIIPCQKVHYFLHQGKYFHSNFSFPMKFLNKNSTLSFRKLFESLCFRVGILFDPQWQDFTFIGLGV